MSPKKDSDINTDINLTANNSKSIRNDKTIDENELICALFVLTDK
jgi:hypothetical protein